MSLVLFTLSINFIKLRATLLVQPCSYLLTAYFLLLTLTSYFFLSGGEYRIRTDDLLLAKQVL